MKTINDINFNSKKALIRVDFNVPLDNEFNVTDTTRIEAAKPTIIKILEDGGSCVLMSHLGRPKGVQEEFSLKHIVDSIEKIIGVEVNFIDNCVGDTAEKAVAELENGKILLLENLRFHEEEKKRAALPASASCGSSAERKGWAQPIKKERQSLPPHSSLNQSS